MIEKLLKLDRPVAERFSAIYRDQYDPDLSVLDSVFKEWIAVDTFRAKEKIIAKPSVVIRLELRRKGAQLASING